MYFTHSMCDGKSFSFHVRRLLTNGWGGKVGGVIHVKESEKSTSDSNIAKEYVHKAKELVVEAVWHTSMYVHTAQ